MPQSPHWSWWWWWRRRQQCKWWRWFNCMNNQCIKIFSSENIAIQCELKWILSTLIANRIEQCCNRTHLNWRLIPSADTSGRRLQNGRFSILFAKDFWVIQLACDGALWSFFANRIEKCSIRHTSTDDSSYPKSSVFNSVCKRLLRHSITMRWGFLQQMFTVGNIF